MTMSSVTYVPLKLWIILNLLSFASSNISSQRFVLHQTSLLLCKYYVILIYVNVQEIITIFIKLFILLIVI